jgi:outer membrane protein TolC
LPARASQELDLQDLPKLESDKLTPFVGPYRTLYEHEAQCQAAQASSKAALLEQEEAQAGRKHHSSRKSEMQQAILRTAALEQRNSDAGDALELFYKLAEAEAKWDLLQQSIKQVDEAIEQGKKLKAQGLKVPAEFEDFQQQQRKLQADRVRLDGGIDKLNRLLGKMLDLQDVPERERLLPAVDLQIAEAPMDIASAVALGLSNRPELQMLRQARDDTSPATVDAIRKLLSVANPLLGMSSSGHCVKKLIALLCKNETGVRQEQIDQYLKQREKEIADDIRQAVIDLQSQVQIVGLARARAKDAQDKLKERQEKRAQGTASAVDVTTARLTLLKARVELTQEMMAWYSARVKLKQAQGLLVIECEDCHGLEEQPHVDRHEELGRPLPETLPLVQGQ